MAPMEQEESRKGGGARRSSVDGPVGGEATAVEAAAAKAPAEPAAGVVGGPSGVDGASAPLDSGDIASALRGTPDTAARGATEGKAAGAGEAAAAADTGKAAAAKGASAAAASSSASSSAATSASADSETSAGLVAPGGRLSKPMVAAAGIAGVLLLCSPFLISQLTSGGGHEKAAPPAASDYDGQGRGAGVVPGAEQPQGQQAPDGGAASGGSGDGGQGGAPAGGATYTAMAGLGCTDKSTGYKEHGTYTDGDEGWTTHKSGGWTKDGCDGSFVSVPMAGDKGDDGNYVLWTFATDAVKSGSCQVRVQVPKDDDIKHVGGHPTRYSVFGAASATGKALGDFTVDQTKKRGDWADGGTYPISGGHLTVKLHTQGIDFGAGFEGAHHAASAVAVKCTA